MPCLSPSLKNGGISLILNFVGNVAIIASDFGSDFERFFRRTLPILSGPLALFTSSLL